MTTPTTPLIPSKSKSKGGGGGGLLLGLAAVVAAAGIAFAAGRLTAPAAAASTGRGNGLGGNFPASSFTPGQGGLARGGVGGGVTIDGTVSAVATGSITVKTAAGTDVTITTNGTTTYHSQSTATASDVAVGGKVQVLVSGGLGGFGRSGGQGAAGSPAPDASGVPGGVQATATDVTIVP